MMYRRAVFSISPEFYKFCSFSQLLDAITSKVKKEAEIKSCIVYFADTLMTISQNVATLTGGNFVGQRLIDILEPQKRNDMAADEIIAHIGDKLEKMGGAESGGAA